MKVNRIFESYDEKLKSLEEYRKSIINDLEEAKKNTNQFLSECNKVGIKVVSNMILMKIQHAVMFNILPC